MTKIIFGIKKKGKKKQDIFLQLLNKKTFELKN